MLSVPCPSSRRWPPARSYSGSARARPARRRGPAACLLVGLEGEEFELVAVDRPVAFGAVSCAAVDHPQRRGPELVGPSRRWVMTGSGSIVGWYVGLRPLRVSAPASLDKPSPRPGHGEAVGGPRISPRLRGRLAHEDRCHRRSAQPQGCYLIIGSPAGGLPTMTGRQSAGWRPLLRDVSSHCRPARGWRAEWAGGRLRRAGRGLTVVSNARSQVWLCQRITVVALRGLTPTTSGNAKSIISAPSCSSLRSSSTRLRL